MERLRDGWVERMKCRWKPLNYGLPRLITPVLLAAALWASNSKLQSFILDSVFVLPWPPLDLQPFNLRSLDWSTLRPLWLLFHFIYCNKPQLLWLLSHCSRRSPLSPQLCQTSTGWWWTVLRKKIKNQPEHSENHSEQHFDIDWCLFPEENSGN